MDAASLAGLLGQFSASFGITVVVASEIEFYLHGSTVEAAAAWEQQVRDACTQAGISIYKVEKERGQHQFEISLCHAPDAVKMAEQTSALKVIVEFAAKNCGMQVDFSAKPLTDEPGSGLHIHVHLQDGAGKNLYFKNDEQMSAELRHSLAGLLAALPYSMGVFAPSEASRLRFVRGSNGPTTISWGANNRTVAIRLPDKPHDNKHIEHRVPGADSDPMAVMYVILQAIYDGLESKAPLELTQIYGDASLPSYGLTPLV